MATTLEIEAALADDDDLFDSCFDEPAGRKWFARKIVAHLSTSPDVEGAGRVYLAKAKDLVFRDDGRGRPYAKISLTRLDALDLLARAKYAAMGVHPEVFLDRENAALLTFVAERRIRTILQMRDYVNDPSGVFYFPWPDVWHSSLRLSARQFWQGNQGINHELWPFVLTAQGQADPKAAVDSLFDIARRVSSEDQHRVECQTAATMVLIDSLSAADRPALLFAALAAGPDGYFAIDNPDSPMRRFPVRGPFSGAPRGGFRLLSVAAAAGTTHIEIVPPLENLLPLDVEPLTLNLLANDDGGVQTVTARDVLPPSDIPESQLIRTTAAPLSPVTVGLIQSLDRTFERGTRIVGAGLPLFHLLTDARPDTALFDQQFVAIEDWQPGDVVHVLGHPIVRSKIPKSAFGGERCVIINPWRSMPQIQVTGHGVGTTTILGLVSSMLRVPNRLLTIARRVLSNCRSPALTLNPVASGNIPTPDNSAAGQALEARIKATIARALNLLDGTETATDFFVGSWEVNNFPAIAAANLPFWDRPAGFSGYPKYWALTAQGTLHFGTDTMALEESRFFVFGYWTAGYDRADPNALLWPAEIDQNFVAMVWGYGGNLGATDERRMFGVPYFDDRAGRQVSMPLFATGPYNAPPQPTVLQFTDLLPQLFNLAKNNNEAWVLRPKVSNETAYLNHLRAIGALPDAP